MVFDFRKGWKFWILLGILIIIILGVVVAGLLKFKPFLPVSNETENKTKAYVEQGVYDSFNNSETSWLYLRVYVSSPEYRDVVINSIPLEVNSNSLSKVGFSAFVKTNRFENLTKDIYVKRIYLESHAPRGLDNKDSLIEEKLYVEPEIYKRLAEGAYVLIVANARSDGEMAIVAKSLSISDEMPFYLYSGSNYFTALVSKKGLEMVSKIKGIEAIRIEPKEENYIDDSAEIIGAKATWDNFSLTGEGKAICVIDSGVNKSHPYLVGQVIHEHCICNTTFGTGCCPNHTSEEDGEGSAIDPPTGTGQLGHGTHVAGIVASVNNTYRGIAYNSKLVVVRIADPYSGIPNIENTRMAIKWCVDHAEEYGISVITRSGGTTTLYPIGYCPDWIPVVIQNASNNSIPITAASGNGSNITSLPWPACANGVIAVGATWKYDFGGSLYNGTNRNSKLKLLAPGTSIRSAKWNPELDATIWGCSNTSDTNFMTCSGTSMATPHVAGAIVLLKGLKEDLTYEQIEDLFYLTGKQIYDANTSLNFSRIDVLKAIMAVNASLLQINNLTEIYSDGQKERIFRFVIKNANLSNITNISWQANIGEDGGIVKSKENITSLLFGESAVILFKYDYAKPGTYVVNVSARAGNLLYSSAITVNVPGWNLSVTQISDLNTKDMQKIIRFKMKNFGSGNLENISWSFDFGDGTNASSKNTFNLSGGEEAFVYLSHDYSSAGSYNISATAFYPNYSDSLNKTITVPSINLDVYGLAIINSSQRDRIFKFVIYNPLLSALNNTNWTIDFGDENNQSSTNDMALVPWEDAFVLVEHTYSSANTYTVNASARNGTLIDSQSISVVVS